MGVGDCINSKLGRQVPTHTPPGPYDSRTGVPQLFAFFRAAILPRGDRSGAGAATVWSENWSEGLLPPARARGRTVCLGVPQAQGPWCSFAHSSRIR